MKHKECEHCGARTHPGDTTSHYLNCATNGLTDGEGQYLGQEKKGLVKIKNYLNKQA
jgi:hypothetical protein